MNFSVFLASAAAAAFNQQPSFKEVYAHPDKYEGQTIRLCGSSVQKDGFIVGERVGKSVPSIRIVGRRASNGCAEGDLQRLSGENTNIVVSHPNVLVGWVFVSRRNPKLKAQN